MDILTGTLLRFKTLENDYGYARVIGKAPADHFIEIFDFFGEFEPAALSDKDRRLMYPQLLDTHTEIETSINGNWEIFMAPEEEFVPEDAENIIFSIGVDGDEKYQNILGIEVSAELGEGCPKMLIKQDAHIQRAVNVMRKKRL